MSPVARSLTLLPFLLATAAASPTASNPYPANADTNGAAPDIVLTWTRGDSAAATNGQDVFFGASAAAVSNGDASAHMGLESATAFDPTNFLAAGTTYYWRVDAVNPGVSPYRWTGDVWRFTVFSSSGMPAGFENGYAVWSTNSMTKVFTNSRPPVYSAAGTASVSLARGEYESFQVGLLAAPGRRLDRVRVQTGNLIGATNAIAASNVTWDLVGLVCYGTNAFPDILLPVSDFDMLDGNAQAVLVTVYAPSGTPAGTYTGSVTVATDSGLPATIGVTATVIDFTLPVGPGHNRNSFTCSQAFKTNWAPGEFRAYGDCLLKFRLNPDDIYRNSTPDIGNLEHWYDLGLNSFNVHKADSLPYPPALAAMTNWLGQLALSPHGAALRDMGFFYGYDEKGPEWFEHMRTNFTTLENLCPDIERLTTCHLYAPDPRPWLNPPADMSQYKIDWMCAEQSLYKFADGETLRGAGYQYWGYNAYLGLTQPHRFLRNLFWSEYQTQADGFLYYAVNGWSGDGNPAAIDPASGPFIPFTPGTPNAIGELVYCGAGGPLASMRMVNLRDGIEDWEYLCGVADKFGSVEVARDIAEKVASGWVTATNPIVTLAARDAAAAWLTQDYLARSPSPDHRATGTGTNVTLRWAPDDPGAVTAYDVYFGTDSNAVMNATTSSPAWQGRQSATNFNPGALPRDNATYYWRIDEVVGGAPWPGYMWQFSTGRGLCGWWKFDESTGAVAADASGNGFDGTIANAGHVAGILGNALAFDGAGHLALPAPALASLYKEVSVALWQYGGGAQPRDDTLVEATRADGGLVLQCRLPYGDGKVYWRAGDGATDTVSRAAGLFEIRGRWNHWVFTKNAGTGMMRVYLNSNLWLEATGCTQSLGTATSFKVGAAADGTQGYLGVVDDVRVYDRELTSNDVASLCAYNNRIGGQGLMGWWRFDEPAGGVAADSSDYRNDGALNRTNQARVAGRVGYGLLFNGSNDFVQIPVSGLSHPRMDLSFTAWTYGDNALPSASHLYVTDARRSDTTTCLTVMIPLSDGTVLFRAGSDVGADTKLSPVVPTNTIKGRWNHWAFTRGDTGLGRMYLNGSLYHSDFNFGIAKVGTLAFFRIGSRTTGTAPYKGVLDEIRLYNYELSADEISAIYQKDIAPRIGTVFFAR